MGQEKELISIIVPVYNAESYIEETVAMVRAQTCQSWELLLVDDHSGDQSLARMETLAKQDHRIRVIAKPSNEGAALARNTGIDHSRGRYIAFLDADDVWMPDKLEKELAFLKEKDAAFVYTAYEFGDEKAGRTGKVVHVLPVLTYKKALSRTIIFTTTVLIDTQKTGKELLHMPDIKSEDTATWWKILKAGYPAYGLDEVLAIYRRPPHSLSSNKLEAVRRIWQLYRRQEMLPLFQSAGCLLGWAWRATIRRL